MGPAVVKVSKWTYLAGLTLAAIGLLVSLEVVYIELYSPTGEPQRLLAGAGLGSAAFAAGITLINGRRLRARCRELAGRIQVLERHASAAARTHAATDASRHEIRKTCLVHLRRTYLAHVEDGCWIAALHAGERVLELFPDDPLARQISEWQPLLTQRIQNDILTRRRPQSDRPEPADPPITLGRNTPVPVERLSPSAVSASIADLQLADHIAESA